MNKYIKHLLINHTNCLFHIGSPDSVCEKHYCRKTANKQDQFKQKQYFKREKDHVQRFILAFFKLLIVEKLAISLRRQQSD